MKYLSKRNLLGGLLFLIFVGEPTVGLATGLFTPPGLLVLAGLYLVLFLLYEALVARFKLTYARLVPLTFALYSVLVTGLLHGELADFTHPDKVAITALIRLQCSLFPVFAYYLLNRWLPRNPIKVLSVKAASLVAFLFFLILTPSKKFGFITLANTVHAAPVLSGVFIALAIVALVIALRPVDKSGTYQSKSFTVITWILLAVACVPTIATLVALLVAMPIVVAVYWTKPAWRQAKA